MTLSEEKRGGVIFRVHLSFAASKLWLWQSGVEVVNQGRYKNMRNSSFQKLPYYPVIVLS